jgi:uncharacterized protein affecting Mg2+/Co2+ transport
VWGAVSLVGYNPRDREGYIFGYQRHVRDNGSVRMRLPGRHSRSRDPH